MPFPIAAAITGGASLLGSILGHHKGSYLSQDDLNLAYQRSNRGGPFHFNPDANDPGLALQNMRASNLYHSNYGRGLNEVYRSGLGGSSIGLKSLEGVTNDYNRNLEDIQAGNFAQQREQQLGQYNSDLDYRRQLENYRIQQLAGANRDNSIARSSAVGGLGQIAGTFLEDYLNKNKKPFDIHDYM